MAAQDPQSRRWSLTINNPKDYGLDHDTIIERLHLFHPRYFCLADEIGESGTYRRLHRQRKKRAAKTTGYAGAP